MSLEWFERLSSWIETMFVATDQWFACWLRGFFFVWFNAERPSADETLSAWIGRNAIAGKPWALRAEKFVDTIMLQPGHCRRAVLTDGQD